MPESQDSLKVRKRKFCSLLFNDFISFVFSYFLDSDFLLSLSSSFFLFSFSVLTVLCPFFTFLRFHPLLFLPTLSLISLPIPSISPPPPPSGLIPRDKAAMGPGPGSYRPLESLGKQALSTKRQAVANAFPLASR